MLLDGSEMDSFADLTHTPQGDVKTRIARGILMVSDLTHTPQGDVKNEAMFSLLPKFKNLTHTPQGDVKAFPLITTWWSSRFNSHPARGHNGRAFSALHECGRKGSFAFLKIYSAVFPTGTAAEPFSGCKTETPETKGQSL